MSREWTQHDYQKLIHWKPEGRKKRGRPEEPGKMEYTQP